MCLSTFLKHSKSVISSPILNSIHIYVGNEASDADSIISALCLAFLRSKIDQENTIHLPVANIKRNDLRLRPDIKLLLQKININIFDIFCLEDYPFHSFSNIKITLMDHNRLPSYLESFKKNVVEIVDHHLDSGDLDHVSGTYRNIAFDSLVNKPKVASACTLVAEEFYLHSSLLSDDVRVALLGTICLDSINMDPKSGLGTERDLIMINFLMEFLNENFRNELFFELKTAKTDRTFWNELSSREALSLDYKSFFTQDGVEIGTSAVLLPIVELVQKPDFVSQLVTHLLHKRLYGIMSLISDPTPVREVLIATARIDDIPKIRDYFIRDNNLRYAFKEHNEIDSRIIANVFSNSPIFILSFQQSNLRFTRKQVAPDMIRYLEINDNSIS